MSEPALLRSEGLSLGYDERVVLKDVHLAIRPGEWWFFVGPNGSGKTTLLNAMLGLLAPRGGRLELAPALRGDDAFGLLPQESVPRRTLPTTVREFVSLGLVGLRLSRAEREERIREALERVGVTPLAGDAFSSLSGGQRRRALIARALVRRPRLLMLDEPTEGLDRATEAAFLATLTALRREGGVTLVVVTHKLTLAAEHASHIALFEAGVVLAGPRDEMLREPAVRRHFGERV